MKNLITLFLSAVLFLVSCNTKVDKDDLKSVHGTTWVDLNENFYLAYIIKENSNDDYSHWMIDKYGLPIQRSTWYLGETGNIEFRLLPIDQDYTRKLIDSLVITNNAAVDTFSQNGIKGTRNLSYNIRLGCYADSAAIFVHEKDLKIVPIKLQNGMYSFSLVKRSK
jgi:hypothetical protein